MKVWKCPNCARERITEENIITVMCRCGYYDRLLDEIIAEEMDNAMGEKDA